MLLSKAALKVSGVSMRLGCRTLGVRKMEFKEIRCSVPGKQCNLVTLMMGPILSWKIMTSMNGRLTPAELPQD